MEFDFDSAEGGLRYENGKRYTLTVKSAEEGESKIKGTPYVRLHLADENGADAFAVDIWNTPKAMFIAAAWFKALGLRDNGRVNADPTSLRGIKLTAACKYETYTGLDGKERKAVRWEDPLPIQYDAGQETGPGAMPGDRRVDEGMSSDQAAAAMAPKGKKATKKKDEEEVPF